MEKTKKNGKNNKKTSLQKNKEKEALAKQKLIEKHTIQLQEKQNACPETEVIHDKQWGERDFACENLTLIVAGKTLLEDTTIKFSEGRRYGLVGRNGIGKTCLLTSFARREFERMTQNLQILLVEQEIEPTDTTVLETVLKTDVERTRLLKEEAEIEQNTDEDSLQRLTEIAQRLDEIDAQTAVSRASTILAGLGFNSERQKLTTKELSGGWRMRVSLARALFVQPDILLLDEPTNHLDMDAVIWLEKYLVNCDSIVVVVSHARSFLNTVCTDIVHFFNKTVKYYKGDYDIFEKTRNDDMIQQQKKYEQFSKATSSAEYFINKFRANNKLASMVQCRIKQLAKMEVVQEVIRDPSCVFTFQQPDRLNPPLLTISDGHFGYNEKETLLQDIDFGVDMDSRIALIGANGAGKSTLIKILMNDLELTKGQSYRNAQMRVAYFSQHHVDQLDLLLNPIEQLQKMYPGEKEETYRSKLAKFGITTELQLQKIYLMSGGQKSRVAFCLNVYKQPHILIMDEPTNHLDLDAINALIFALNQFEGGVLVVSHDQHLITNVCDQICYIKEKKLKRFDGDFDGYRKAFLNGTL